jgi:hypothetical protein
MPAKAGIQSSPTKQPSTAMTATHMDTGSSAVADDDTVRDVSAMHDHHTPKYAADIVSRVSDFASPASATRPSCRQ